MNDVDQLGLGQIFNPYGVQFPYPQIGGLFGGYNMGVPWQSQQIGFKGFLDQLQSLFEQPQDLNIGLQQSPYSGQPAEQQAGALTMSPRVARKPSSGVAPGLFETDTVTPRRRPAYDRTFVSGGIGKNAGPTRQVFPGKPNFGNRYAKTGKFGQKGLNFIRSLGYTGDASTVQSQFLEDNPLIAKRYKPKVGITKSSNPGRRNTPRTL